MCLRIYSSTEKIDWVHMYIFVLQECQFLSIHTKQYISGERLSGAEIFLRLLKLSKRHRSSAAWLLQPTQARKASAVRARWFVTGGLLRSSAGLQFWGATSQQPRRPWLWERGGVYLQNSLQHPRHHAQQRALARQLWLSHHARLLLSDPTDIWQEPQLPDAIQLWILLRSSA